VTGSTKWLTESIIPSPVFARNGPSPPRWSLERNPNEHGRINLLMPTEHNQYLAQDLRADYLVHDYYRYRPVICVRRLSSVSYSSYYLTSYLTSPVLRAAARRVTAGTARGGSEVRHECYTALQTSSNYQSGLVALKNLQCPPKYPDRLNIWILSSRLHPQNGRNSIIRR
jgi:hypothetical protein